MAWITPVFDRTQDDVDFAISKIQEWKDSGVTDTTDLKGCFNVSDLNRIEGNIRYLADSLSELYYFATLTTKTWDRSGLPSITDVNRIVDNTRNLILSFSEHAPELPTTLLTITDVNCIEENLYKVKEILDGMIISFMECDTFECGEG